MFFCKLIHTRRPSAVFLQSMTTISKHTIFYNGEIYIKIISLCYLRKTRFVYYIFNIGLRQTFWIAKLNFFDFFWISESLFLRIHKIGIEHPKSQKWFYNTSRFICISLCKQQRIHFPQSIRRTQTTPLYFQCCAQYADDIYLHTTIFSADLRFRYHNWLSFL